MWGSYKNSVCCSIKKIQRFFVAVYLFLLLSVGINITSGQTGCIDCRRTAVLENFSNLHASQYEKQLDEWNRCMQNELGPYASFDADDPKVKQAMEKCAGLAPPASDNMSPSGLTGKLSEVLRTNCFHIIIAVSDYSAFPQKIPEYQFRGSFDAGITEQTDGHGREIRSRLIIELWYNGDPVELLKSWTTESTLASISSQYNQMFDNSDAVLRKERPIDNLLHDFERRPVTCIIDAGSKDELGPGEEAEIRILDFKDDKGRSSKYFNRIIVEAERGHIKGGSRLLSDPVSNKYRAFRLDQVPVTFTYEAPDDGTASTDKIIIYSSCQILDPGKVPMEFTEPDKKIAEKEIKIIRPDLTAEYFSTLEEFSLVNEMDYLITFNSSIRASYRLLKVSARKDEGTITESYQQISSGLKSFSGNGEISWKKVSVNCVETASGTATASGGIISQATKILRITYDSGSGEVLKVKPDNFTIECNMDGRLEVTQKCSKPSETRTSNMPWPLRYIPKTKQGMVADYPEFQNASGNRNSGTITGGGEKIIGPWRLNIRYTINKAVKK